MSIGHIVWLIGVTMYVVSMLMGYDIRVIDTVCIVLLTGIYLRIGEK